MSNIDLNNLRDRAYQCAKDHGFHKQELSNEHYLMLVITELSEAVEADRKGRRFKGKMKFEHDLNLYSALVKYDVRFKSAFEKHVKDTVEDELADAIIRLLDLAGLRNIDINDTFVLNHAVFEDKTFTENCFAIIKEMASSTHSFEDNVSYVIYEMLEMAGIYQIDIFWHIEQKMKYNELREYRHGKKY